MWAYHLYSLSGYQLETAMKKTMDTFHQCSLRACPRRTLTYCQAGLMMSGGSTIPSNMQLGKRQMTRREVAIVPTGNSFTCVLSVEVMLDCSITNSWYITSFFLSTVRPCIYTRSLSVTLLTSAMPTRVVKPCTRARKYVYILASSAFRAL